MLDVVCSANEVMICLHQKSRGVQGSRDGSLSPFLLRKMPRLVQYATFTTVLGTSAHFD